MNPVPGAPGTPAAFSGPRGTGPQLPTEPVHAPLPGRPGGWPPKARARWPRRARSLQPGHRGLPPTGTATRQTPVPSSMANVHARLTGSADPSQALRVTTAVHMFKYAITHFCAAFFFFKLRRASSPDLGDFFFFNHFGARGWGWGAVKNPAGENVKLRFLTSTEMIGEILNGGTHTQERPGAWFCSAAETVVI